MSNFGDVIKSASDLLSKAFKYDNKVEVKTTTKDGVTFKSTATLGDKGVSADIDAKFAHNNLKFDKLRVGTDGVVKGEMTLASVTDGLDATFKAEEGTAGSGAKGKGVFGLDYTNADFGNIRANVDVINGPIVTADCLFNYEGFLLGGAVNLNTNLSSGKKAGDSKDDEAAKSEGMQVTDYNVCLGYDAPKDFRFAVTTSNTLQKVTGAYFQNVNAETQAAAKFDFNRADGSWGVAVGGKYALTGDASVQGMVKSSGTVSGVYTQKFNSAVTLAAAAEVDATQLGSDKHKFGLKLSFSG